MSKRSGKRCRRLVVGSPVCVMHGGAAPAVRARRAARILEWEAQQEAAVRGTVHEPRSPHEVLLSSIDLSDRVMLQLWRDFQRGELSPELGRALGEWADRAGKLSAVALNANVAERWVQAQSQVAQAQAARLIRAMDRCMSDPSVAVVGDPREVIRDALRQLNDPAPGLRVLPA